MSNTQKFWVTKEHERFTEFCDACRHYRYIGLCYGVPGVGKTLSARRYANWHRIEPFINAEPKRFDAPKLYPRQMRTVLYTPNVVNSPKRIRDQIADLRGHLVSFIYDRVRQKNPDASGADTLKRLQQRELIIVDEADRLNVNGFEEIRDIYDRYDLAVIFVGMPGIEKRLTRYPQLYSRIGFVHHFRLLDEAQMTPVVDYQWQKICGHPFDETNPHHTDARATIAMITNGNFRLIERLFAQIERVLKINELSEINREVVEVARESLVIGVN